MTRPKRTRSLPGVEAPAPSSGGPDRRKRARGTELQHVVERIRKGQPERRSFRDRRATPRLKVSVVLETGRRRCVTHDLSTFGLSIAKGETPAIGSRLSLRLFLPDQPAEPVQLEARVLGPFDEQGGLRLRFISPEVAAVRRIHRLVK